MYLERYKISYCTKYSFKLFKIIVGVVTLSAILLTPRPTFRMSPRCTVKYSSVAWTTEPLMSHSSLILKNGVKSLMSSLWKIPKRRGRADLVLSLIPKRTWLMMRKTTDRIALMAGKLNIHWILYATAAQLYESSKLLFHIVFRCREHHDTAWWMSRASLYTWHFLWGQHLWFYKLKR